MINNQRKNRMVRIIGAVKLQPLLGAGVFCLLSSMFSPLHAEVLPDPTRPPASIFQTASGRGVGLKAEQSSGLRSIIISETRSAAIIDGKTVELGGRFGNATLVEVNAGSVVLQHGKNRRVLTLFPNVKISHKEIPDPGSSKMESPNKKTHVVQPPQVINRTPPSQEFKPAAHQEKRLSGHPKEEK